LGEDGGMIGRPAQLINDAPGHGGMTSKVMAFGQSTV
jgi:hypothetical protein